MFSLEAAEAVAALQKRASSTTDSYTLERIDRALDEITRHPEKTDPAAFQIRSAMANAGKVMANRRALAPLQSVDDPHLEPGYFDSGYDRVETMRWLDEATVSEPHRHALRALASGDGVAVLAADAGIEVQRMRERVSRARRALRADYIATVAAA